GEPSARVLALALREHLGRRAAADRGEIQPLPGRPAVGDQDLRAVPRLDGWLELDVERPRPALEAERASAVVTHGRAVEVVEIEVDGPEGTGARERADPARAADRARLRQELEVERVALDVEVERARRFDPRRGEIESAVDGSALAGSARGERRRDEERRE